MLLNIDEAEPQKCFEIDGFLFCNWVKHPTRKGIIIKSNSGKLLKMQIQKEKPSF
jgi:hypothetical protein